MAKPSVQETKPLTGEKARVRMAKRHATVQPRPATMTRTRAWKLTSIPPRSWTSTSGFDVYSNMAC